MFITGKISFAGDKSLSHRAAILAGLSKGLSQIKNFLPAQDTINTLKALESLGVRVFKKSDYSELEIESKGKHHFKNSGSIINVGNSGTAARLLMGLISGCEALSITLDGDETLRKRPMKRITAPLSDFGASFEPLDYLPIKVYGNKLSPVFLREKLGSAQVKSACLLAALASETNVEIEEIKPSRNHTENMLISLGVDLSIEEKKENDHKVIRMKAPYSMGPSFYDLWGDISSASFFVVMALLVKKSNILIQNILLNPYRTKYLGILKKMGGNITTNEKEKKYNEKGGDIEVKFSHLKNISIAPKEVPSIIDELPILVVAAMFSEGVFEIRGAEELRHKESDRIHAICSNLKSLGYDHKEYNDGFSLEGRPEYIPNGEIQGFKDHRILMAFEVAGIVSQSLLSQKKSNQRKAGLKIPHREKNWIQTSFPDFYRKIERLSS